MSSDAVTAELDFETYSEAGFLWDAVANRWRPPQGAQKPGLFAVGAAAYSEHPTCEILCATYRLPGGQRTPWRPGMPPPVDLFAHIAAGGLVEAFNVGFERWAWVNVAATRMGWPHVPFEQWRCAMARSRAHALPGGLEPVGRVLALTVQKNADGKRLLKKFSQPRNPTQADSRTRIVPLWTETDVVAELADLVPALRPRAAALRKLTEGVQADCEDTQRLLEYNDTDVAVEVELGTRIPHLTPVELAYWRDDQAINYRGVRIDMAGVLDCIAIIEQAHARYGEELQALAGCKPSEIAKLTGWLHGRGVSTHSLDEDAVVALLARTDLPVEARRALEIRAAVGAASVKKVYAMRNHATRHSRLHDLYTYHGAHTGRPTGNGSQPTNLPKAGPEVRRCGYVLAGGRDVPLVAGGCGRYHGAHTMTCHWCQRTTVRTPTDPAREWSPDAADDALAAISTRALDVVETLFGDAMLTVSGVLRALFIASPGCDLISSDFTAIEGVVIAAIADEKWRLEVFRTHGKIYEASAAQSTGIPFDEILAYRKRTGQHHPVRTLGKFQELALGFGGWINGWKAFGGPGTDEEITQNILTWRDASPAIVELWGGQARRDHYGWREDHYGLEGAAVLAVLNAGRSFQARRLDGTDTGVSYETRGRALYCTVPSGGVITYHNPVLMQGERHWRGLELSFEGWNTNPKNGPVGWVRKKTYSGKLAENVVQKTARDIQMNAIRRCEASGRYPVVMHTYDEIVAEVRQGDGSVEELELLMTVPAPWHADWPIKAAGGWRRQRYCKA